MPHVGIYRSLQVHAMPCSPLPWSCWPKWQFLKPAKPFLPPRPFIMFFSSLESIFQSWFLIIQLLSKRPSLDHIFSLLCTITSYYLFFHKITLIFKYFICLWTPYFFPLPQKILMAWNCFAVYRSTTESPKQYSLYKWQNIRATWDFVSICQW